MRRNRGSVRGSAAAKNRHAQQDAVGRAVNAKVVEEAFCEEGVNVQDDHNAALFKQYVDEYAPDGLRVRHMRADTANIKWASYVKHSHAKDTAVCHNDLDDGDGGAAEQP
eukprot:jgi/Tetstr1/440264/TSEL_028615.t1